MWWEEIRNRQQWTRVAAGMALVEMKHVPAMRPLAAMVAEQPLPDYDHVADCAAIVAPVCAWIGRSDLLEAKAAIAEHDRLNNQPGAWRALCAQARHTR